jgi:hypothetical protein
MTRFLLRSGGLCLAVVALIRGAEHFQLVPVMGWGPDSPMHYLALTCGIVGATLLLAGILVGLSRSRRAR